MQIGRGYRKSSCMGGGGRGAGTMEGDGEGRLRGKEELLLCCLEIHPFSWTFPFLVADTF